jgi:tRNA(Ile)-lysidine synthase
MLAASIAPGCVLAATVDHGLRRASADEATTVAAFCAQRGIVHTTLTVELGSGTALQERARAARYAALGEWAETQGLPAIAAAHHADDQAETLLMRLNRGAGVRGLAAMRAVATVPGYPGLALLRPLLGWRRSELARIVADAGISPVDDPSNRDARFERARLRQDLAGTPWLDAAAIAASASHLAEADAVIDWAADRALDAASLDGKTVRWAPDQVPRAIALRVLERIVVRLGGGTPRGSAVARWHDLLAAGEVATLAGVRGDGREPVWQFGAAPAPRSPQKVCPKEGP